MPRLLGVDIPNDKPSVISLTYLYGVGPKVARDLCHKAGVDPQKRARELAEDELGRRQPLAGHQMLSRHPSPVGVTRTWAADADQCPYAQGTAEDRGGQEGCEGSAVVESGYSRRVVPWLGGCRESIDATEILKKHVGANRQWRRARNANFVGTSRWGSLTLRRPSTTRP
jgi:hypothetical protein